MKNKLYKMKMEPGFEKWAPTVIVNDYDKNDVYYFFANAKDKTVYSCPRRKFLTIYES